MHDMESDSNARLVAMWVAPSHRGTGIAQALVQHIIAWAQARGATTLVAGITPQNLRAQTFYRRIGFKLVSPNHLGKSDPTKHGISLQMVVTHQASE